MRPDNLDGSLFFLLRFPHDRSFDYDFHPTLLYSSRWYKKATKKSNINIVITQRFIITPDLQNQSLLRCQRIALAQDLAGNSKNAWN